MTRIAYHEKIHFYISILISFSIPIGMFTPILIALLLLNWIIEGDFNNKFKSVGNSKVALLFIGYYFIHVLGLFYTQNMAAGLFDLEVKLSLLLFPIIFVSRPINKLQQQIIFKAFIAGGIIISLIMLSSAVYKYMVNEQNSFFYIDFGLWNHPSYVAMYLNFAIAGLLLKNLNAEFKGIISKFVVSIIILFFSIIVMLLSSKAGIISLFLIYAGFILYYIISHKKILIGIVGIIIISLSIYLVALKVPQIANRFKSLISEVSNNTSQVNNEGSTSIRIAIWKASSNVIKDNFLLGVGTGDSKDALIAEYKYENLQDAISNNLNAHNQFYQVFVSLGLIGFTLLILSLLIPCKIAFESRNFLYLLLITLLVLNFIPESMLEKKAGVMFYAFFNSLLYFRYREEHS